MDILQKPRTSGMGAIEDISIGEDGKPIVTIGGKKYPMVNFGGGGGLVPMRLTAHLKWGVRFFTPKPARSGRSLQLEG